MGPADPPGPAAGQHRGPSPWVDEPSARQLGGFVCGLGLWAVCLRVEMELPRENDKFSVPS